LDSQLNIVIHDIYILKLLQENDQNIMGKLLKIEKCIQRVNQCWLFLQITWLLEMTDPQGNTVILEFVDFTGTHTNVSQSNLTWPLQALLLPKSWEIWKN
jgi:hypothetical protein